MPPKKVKTSQPVPVPKPVNENQNIDDTFTEDVEDDEPEPEQVDETSESEGDETESETESTGSDEVEEESIHSDEDNPKQKKKKKKADDEPMSDDDANDDDCFYDYEDPPEAEELNELAEEKKDDAPASLRIPNDERVTRPVLTSYEFVRVLGTRAQQIALGAKPMIKSEKFKINQELSPIDIAKLEIYYDVCPLVIRRPIDADGRYEQWKLQELEKIDFKREVAHLLVD